jgi:RimJ/RimL family protein N-acetyltransferase
MLTGKSVHLRAWREEDLPVLTELRNDVQLQAQLLARARGSRPEQVREWLHSRSEKVDSLLFIISDCHSEEAQGFIQVSGLDTVDSHADLGICLIGKAQGRGKGGESISLLANYLREHWRLRKLNLRVRADNDVALRCYQKVGFERCGLLRQHIFIEGGWQDVALMECFLNKAD